MRSRAQSSRTLGQREARIAAESEERETGYERNSDSSADHVKTSLPMTERGGYAIKNAILGVAMFHELLDSMRIITFEGQTAHLSETSQHLRGIAQIMPHSGMRPEVAFRMRVEEIDFKQKIIFNPFGKTKPARRLIPMRDHALSLLMCRVKEEEKIGTPFVFPSLRDAQKPIRSV